MIGNSNKQAHNRDFWESSLKSKISSKIINGSEQKVAAPMYRVLCIVRAWGQIKDLH
jgi:hypothetical protein